jgi:transcriptional regulator GlxA family with amidase domain
MTKSYGAIAFAVQSILKEREPSTTVADVAKEHGFVNLGRFSAEYRALFAEYPSQTVRARRLS